MAVLYVALPHMSVLGGTMACTHPVLFFYIVQDQAETRPLVLISGFIHDIGSFIDEHPGGAHLLKKYVGKDATTAFFGGVYDHSNAAHNVRSRLFLFSFFFVLAFASA